jgi:fluoride ion exporter CrcB/FEX
MGSRGDAPIVQRLPLLLVKLLLAPALVAAATLAGRRFGVRFAGVIGGLPVVVGPILLALAISHGARFAATAAVGTLAGLLSLCGFMLAYAWTARRTGWPGALAAGWAAFAIATLLLDQVRLPAGAALAAVALAFWLTARLLPSSPRAPEAGEPLRFDLPMRMGATAALVLILTGTAGALGPHLSGLLAAFPVLASVLAVFTHRQDGPDATAAFLRGLVGGLGGFTVFCFAVAELLPDTGIAAAFTVATVSSLLAGALATVGALAGERRAVQGRRGEAV